MANKVTETLKLQRHTHKKKRATPDELEAINKGLQELKIDAPNCRIITLNMGKGKTEKGEGTVPERRSTIKLVIESEYPDILFVQEVMAPTVTAWRLDIGNNYDKRNSGKEAGVLWDTDVFEFREEVDAGKKNTVFQSITRVGTRWGGDAETIGVIPGRACIVCLKHTSSSRYIIAVSWHGPWTVEAEIKAKVFEALQDFCLAVRDRYFNRLRPVPAIVMGGDFNVSLEASYRGIIQGELREGFMFPSYEASERRHEKETIDYFVHSPDVVVRGISALEMTKDRPASSFCKRETTKTSQKILQSIDHDPVKGYLIFTSPY